MRAVVVVAALLLQSTVSAFVIPFKLAAVTNVTTGGAVLEQNTQSFFVANITVGTPPQLFTVIIDTASADFWIPDSTCTTCGNKRLFNSGSSSSWQKFGRTFMASNHFGVTEGFFGKDTLRLATDDRDMIVIPTADIGQVLELPAAVSALNGVDGVLGLAFPSVSSDRMTQPAFIRGAAQGDIAQPIFSIWLEEQWQTSDNGTHGVIYYGGFDLVHCRPNRSFVQLSAARLFQFTLSNLFVNNMGVARRIQVDCNTKLELDFDVGNNVLLKVNERNLILSNNDGTCTLAVMPTDANVSIWDRALNSAFL
ncbi:eukaryotic aspartyl protease [Ostertagia ostertagi]